MVAVNKLKAKYIKDCDKFLKRLYKGYMDDYQFLLYEIAVIEYPDYFNEQIYQYLMNV